MDNKIKIVASLLLGAFLSSCIGLLDNDYRYKRELNEWASMEYSVEGNIYRPNYIGFILATSPNKDIGERISFGSGAYFVPKPIIEKCLKIVYNNNYILAKGEYYDKDSSYVLSIGYYKVTPIFAKDNITPNGYVVDTLSVSTFNKLVKDCEDCQELDADKIRQLDNELDQGGFPIKTVVFFSLIFLYVFYKIYKRIKKKKVEENRIGMDNKIKIVASLLLAFVFSSCVGWLENDTFNERPLNNWASVRYFSNQGYRGENLNISFSPRDTFLKNERIDIGVNSEYRHPMISDCLNVIYNNDYILVYNQCHVNDTSYSLIDCYYKIKPTFSSNDSILNGYTIDTIAKAKYEDLVSNCRDCEELDADKIRELDYELDHGGFPTKTIVFFSLIFLYVFYKIYKRIKKKKGRRK